MPKTTKTQDKKQDNKKKDNILKLPMRGTPKSMLAYFLDESETIESVAMIVEFKDGTIVPIWTDTNSATLALMCMGFDEQVRTLMR